MKAGSKYPPEQENSTPRQLPPAFFKKGSQNVQYIVEEEYFSCCIAYNRATTENLIICQSYKIFLFHKCCNISELLKNIKNANILYILRSLLNTLGL